MSSYPELTSAEQVNFVRRIKLDVEELNTDAYDVNYLINRLHGILYLDGVSGDLFRQIKPFYDYLINEVVPALDIHS